MKKKKWYFLGCVLAITIAFLGGASSASIRVDAETEDVVVFTKEDEALLCFHDEWNDYDGDQNGSISVSEAEKILKLRLKSRDDLKKLMYLPNLETLVCGDKRLTSLDVSRCHIL